MSSGQRKRPGGAAESGQAQKRCRLQPSRTAGTSQTERAELVESGTAALEPAAGQFIDHSSQSSVPEVIVILSDDESPLEREQSQQLQYLSGASDNSDEQQARDDEEGLREDDGDWLLYDFDFPYWSEENSEDRDQNPQHSHPSRSAENSVGPLAIHDNEETRDSDGAWPAVPASSPVSEDEDSDSEVQDREQSQLYPLGSRDTENSAELSAGDNEEEAVENDNSVNSSEWPDRFESPPTWQDDITDDWEESQQLLLGSRSAENSLELASNLLEEPRDIEFEWPGGLVSPPNWEDENAQLPEVNEEERSNVTVNSHDQLDGSGNGRGANEAPVAASAPAEQGAEEQDTQSSEAQQGIIIKCPICMDFYSEIMQHGQQLVATTCGHIFCSRCLPVALETAHMCPTCRVHLSPQRFHPIYL